VKKGVDVGAGVVDEDYRGEVSKFGSVGGRRVGDQLGGIGDARCRVD